ncbi:heme exporter protein CcmB [Paenibacillus athensensis]|uniref:heme exporter protein CcmB n=1 Tax=Paenibacillus athensensis TaxID=1967502 RepID=UPI00143126B9|nr:heme exporter protein CcmB [Paenibacillus athensensis]MCD1261058.1 heme exporter protein CcmB [Paenibacillus athensensis]
MNNSKKHTAPNGVISVLYKEWLAESRSKQVVVSMTVFALLIIVVFSFAFDPANHVMRNVFPGIIWVMIVFAAILGLNRAFVGEQLNDGLTGMLMAPFEWSAIYIGKCLFHFALLILTNVLTVPLLFLLFDFRWEGSAVLLALVIVLGSLGLVVVGVLLAAVAANGKGSELLLPVLLLPLLTPLLIAAVKATTIVLAGGGWSDCALWLELLLAYNIVFGFAGWLLFDYIMEG